MEVDLLDTRRPATLSRARRERPTATADQLGHLNLLKLRVLVGAGNAVVRGGADGFAHAALQSRGFWIKGIPSGRAWFAAASR
jgi:hypothetical protein